MPESSTVRRLLLDPVLNESTLLAGDEDRPAPTSVHIVERLGDLTGIPAEGLAILGEQASAQCLGYRLDVTLREAADRRLMGVMLTGSTAPIRVGATAAGLARKARVVLLSAPANRSLAELVIAVDAAIQGGAEQALRRAQAVLQKLREAEAECPAGDTEALRRAGSEGLGLALEIGDRTDGAVSSQVMVDGQPVATVTARRMPGHLGTATRIAVALVSGAMERSLETVVRTQEAPIRSRDAVLSELLVAGETHTPELVSRARHLGVTVDGWHRALLLQAQPSSEDPGFDFVEALGRFVLRRVSTGAHQWHVARSADAVVLLQMWRRDPPAAAHRGGLESAKQVVAAASAQFTQVQIRCGVGTIHEGVPGLRATVAEARAALANRGTQQVAAFDEAGLQTMLLEWYGTDTARQAVKDLLGPLDQLGGERAQTAIRTLQAYLDEQGSLVRVAKRLHLHRNAVAYRMKKIAHLLHCDLHDPEQRLALQLACRARLFQ